jgi:excisionase family DNA binding protein
MRGDAPELPELWDAERLAAYLDVSKHYVYRLTSEHRIRFVRVGKCLRFRPEDVAA